MPACALLSLGSNLGSRWHHLSAAVSALAREDPALACSSVYETAPIGGPAAQGLYLNVVVSLTTDRTPDGLLDLAHELEATAGRVRQERWGARTLDVDLLWFEGVVSKRPELTLPHPRCGMRAFVLVPLAELTGRTPPVPPIDADLLVELAGAKWRDRLRDDIDGVRRVGVLLGSAA